ncbi:MAG TPA: DUF362 domain-containing protein [Nitrospirota bacterium]|nr:DUF362 domain-containing protein [Nitrospirota bacterium]
MSIIMIHPASYENVRQAIDRAFELFPVQIAGQNVLIKPNVLRSSEAKEGIVTHPAVLRAVVEKVETMGPASLIVGDNPGLFSDGANEEGFSKTGLMEAAKGYYQNIGNDSLKVAFDPKYMSTVSISRAALDADVIISLPKFKKHGLTVVTGAVKNSYGLLPGARKAMLHKATGNPRDFNEVVVEVFRLRVPDLFIVDAVVGMEGNGPASPDLRNIGAILASDNAVAVDSVIATMMGCDPGGLRFLQKAKETGLGDHDLRTIEIIGELKRLPDFKLPPLGGEAIFHNEAMQSLIPKRASLRPQADPEKYTSCGTCVDHCPASALFTAGNIPQVNANVCIACFCCQEMCPEKAMTLR